MPHELIRYSCTYILHMSPTLDASSAEQYLKRSGAIEIRDKILDFYTGLSHVLQTCANMFPLNKHLPPLSSQTFSIGKS